MAVKSSKKPHPCNRHQADQGFNGLGKMLLQVPKWRQCAAGHETMLQVPELWQAVLRPWQATKASRFQAEELHGR